MTVSFNAQNVRLTHKYSNNAGDFTWLFIPGGPGLDSRYLETLLHELSPLPGKVYLLDFPGSGSHFVPDQQFDDWLSLFTPTIAGFKNPIIVGHSFGGMFPYLFPACETILSGFVSLNSAPCLWLEAAAKFAQKNALPDLTADMLAFTQSPSQKTFNKALETCMPYYFPKHTLQKGKDLLVGIDFPYEPAVWWQQKAAEISFNAKWIPDQLPTMIIGGEHDAICPFVLYQEDIRFDRSNIQKIYIEGAGHCPWIEKPQEMKKAFEEFVERLMPGTENKLCSNQ